MFLLLINRHDYIWLNYTVKKMFKMPINSNPGKKVIFSSLSIADGSTSQATRKVASCKRMILETATETQSSEAIAVLSI